MGVSTLPGVGNKTESKTSVTQSAIATGTIVITDEANQKQDINTLSRNTATAHEGLTNDFDAEKLKYEEHLQQLTAETTAQVGNIVSQSLMESAMREYEAKAAADPNYKNSQEYQDAYKAAQAQYGTGSTFHTVTQSVAGALTMAAGGNGTAAIAAAGLSPAAARAVGQLTESGSLENVLAHAILGYVTAEALSGNGMAGAAGAAGSAAAANILANALFEGKPVADLSEEERQTLSSIVTVVGSAIGAATAGSGNTVDLAVAAAQGGISAKNEVENNYLSPKEAKERERLKLAQELFNNCSEGCQERIAELEKLDKERNAALAACSGVSSGECDAIRQEVLDFASDYIRKGLADISSILIEDRNQSGGDQIPVQSWYGEKENEAWGLAQDLMQGYTVGNEAAGAGNAVIGMAESIGSALMFLLFYDDEQKAKAINSTVPNLIDNPENLVKVLGMMTPAERNALADAVQKGDGETAAKLMGGRVVDGTLAAGTIITGVGAGGNAAKVGNTVAKVENVAAKVGDLEKIEDIVEGLSFRHDLPQHLAGPDGFKGAKLFGTHNMDNAISALEAKGQRYSIAEVQPGIYEITYYDLKGNKQPAKTVYDPKVYSDSVMLEMVQKAGEQAWMKYLKNPTSDTVNETYNGVNFKVYINYQEVNGVRVPYIGNVHPIP